MRNLDLMKHILRQGWPYHWMILLYLLSTTASGMLMALLLSKLGPFLQNIGAIMRGGTLGSVPPTGDLVSLGFYLLSLALPAGISSYLSWWSGQWVANRTMRDLRDRLLSHLVMLDISFHGELRRGDLLTRLTTDLNGVLHVQQQLYGKILQRPLEALGILGYAAYLDIKLFAVLILILVLSGLVLVPLVRRTRGRSRRARETQAANFSVLEQITAGIRVVKAMGSSERERLRYAEHNLSLFNDNMRLVRTRAQSDAITTAAVFAISGGGMLVGSWLFSHQLIDATLLIFAIAALGRLINSERDVVRTWGDVQEGLPSVERVYALLGRSSRIRDRPHAKPCPRPTHEIRLEGVSFRYGADDLDVLRGVDLTIPIGKTIALVGPTGAGKSTLLDLLPRFHDVTAGRITIDGTDLRDLTLASLAPLFAIVQQDSFLFDDTIYSNISYGRPGATRAEVEQAATRAHVHADILALEGGAGYQTQVGDRGARLSGGQRQRIAIARALLRDAPILLLDEATSSLDADSERHVQAALLELMRNRTVVVIAHRLATIQHADIIYVFAGKSHTQRGSIIASGSHRDLIARGGDYADLVRLQQLAS